MPQSKNSINTSYCYYSDYELAFYMKKEYASQINTSTLGQKSPFVSTYNGAHVWELHFLIYNLGIMITMP
jgi:hypothetical protein